MAGIRALVVDDYTQMRMHLVELLSSLQITCLQASCGTEALEVLRHESVDMIFTDLVMPEMDGFELCEEIRRRPNLQQLPIVVTSTHRDAKYVIQALQRGADDYVSKPATQHTVARVLSRVGING